jgi:hypothetical protein
MLLTKKGGGSRMAVEKAKGFLKVLKRISKKCRIKKEIFRIYS